MVAKLSYTLHVSGPKEWNQNIYGGREARGQAQVEVASPRTELH